MKFSDKTDSEGENGDFLHDDSFDGDDVFFGGVSLSDDDDEQKELVFELSAFMPGNDCVRKSTVCCCFRNHQHLQTLQRIILGKS